MNRMSTTAVLAALMILPIAAAAGDNRSDFGLGLMIGEPSGLSAKAWRDSATAFDFGLAWSTGRTDGLTVQADYVRHRFDAFDDFDVEKGALLFYYGIGVRLRDREDADSNLGVRIPLGMDYLVSGAPVDVFLEVVPILDLTPDSEVDVNAAFGARYYF